MDICHRRGRYAYFANEFKVAGDDLYYQTNGTTACMPLGTAIIEEVKAPVGYTSMTA